jgi:hypothetical protein
MLRGDPVIERDPDTRHMQRFDALSIAVDVRADADILAEVAALCARWQAPLPDPTRRRIGIDILLNDEAGGTGPIRLEAEGGRLTVSGPEVSGVADARLGHARCAVSRAFARSGRLIEEVIEPLLLFLIGHAGRTPLHAAAFLVDDIAVVLAGPTGTGKSCLAHAALRAGLPVLSDDTVHVQLHPALRLWGLPRAIHLFAKDAPAEASGPMRWRNGKHKRAVTAAPARPLTADRAVLCTLVRGDAVSLEARIGKPWLPAALEPGFDLLRPQSMAAYAALSARGHARLTLGKDPGEAIATLLHNRAALAGIATPCA